MFQKDFTKFVVGILGIGILTIGLSVVAGIHVAAAQEGVPTTRPIIVTPESTLQSIVRRQQLKEIFSLASLNQTVYHKGDRIYVSWPQDMTACGVITLRIQAPNGRIYTERITYVEPGSVICLGDAYTLRDGRYQVVLMPSLGEYYMGGLRVSQRFDIDIRVWQP